MHIPVIVVVLTTASNTYYFSDGAYLTKATDTPALRSFDARLIGKITYSREVTCATWGGGKSTTGLGAIELRNTDGGLDNLSVDDEVKGALLQIYEGFTDDAFAALTLKTTTRVDRVEPQGEKAQRIVTTSLLKKLDETPLQQTVYAVGDVIAQVELLPKPIAIGHPLSCPIPKVSDVDCEFDCHDSSSFGGVTMVRDAGYPLVESVGYVAATGLGRFGIEKLALPVGKVVAEIGRAHV